MSASETQAFEGIWLTVTVNNGADSGLFEAGTSLTT